MNFEDRSTEEYGDFSTRYFLVFTKFREELFKLRDRSMVRHLEECLRQKPEH
jgi:hypothetical protein